MQQRTVGRTFKARPTTEGAGVRLKRVFGFHDIPLLDPFLLLDHFGSDDPQDYRAGFPWHPHRGIETVTYMISGSVEHGDSLGNRGVIRSGDIQWMTAGSGIIHQEMPEIFDGEMVGFQLWVNLPATHKMMPPRYRGIHADQVPAVSMQSGTSVRVIAGRFGDTHGPVVDLVVPCQYLDVTVNSGSTFNHEVSPDDTVFVYVFEGEGRIGEKETKSVPAGHLALLTPGNLVNVTPTDGSVRFLLVAGRPIREPIAWGGPIVMNTQEELAKAFVEYQRGTFLKHTRA